MGAPPLGNAGSSGEVSDVGESHWEWRGVDDLLTGFFIIAEKQYGFGDLVQLTIGASNEAVGTVEDVTLRVTKLR